MVRVTEAILSSKPKAPYSVFTIYGSSQETKPTTADIADGSVFVETDTQAVYMYDKAAATWREVSF